MSIDDEKSPSKGQFLIYQSEDGGLKIDLRFGNETTWLAQQYTAELFQSSKQNITHHISSVYAEDELAPEATVKKYLTVRCEGSPEVKLPKLFQQIDTSKQSGGHLNDD